MNTKRFLLVLFFHFTYFHDIFCLDNYVYLPVIDHVSQNGRVLTELFVSRFNLGFAQQKGVKYLHFGLSNNTNCITADNYHVFSSSCKPTRNCPNYFPYIVDTSFLDKTLICLPSDTLTNLDTYHIFKPSIGFTTISERFVKFFDHHRQIFRNFTIFAQITNKQFVQDTYRIICRPDHKCSITTKFCMDFHFRYEDGKVLPPLNSNFSIHNDFLTVDSFHDTKCTFLFDKTIDTAVFYLPYQFLFKTSASFDNIDYEYLSTSVTQSSGEEFRITENFVSSCSFHYLSSTNCFSFLFKPMNHSSITVHISSFSITNSFLDELSDILETSFKFLVDSLIYLAKPLIQLFERMLNILFEKLPISDEFYTSLFVFLVLKLKFDIFISSAVSIVLFLFLIFESI